MKFPRETVSQIIATANLTRDPAGATIELQISGTWRPCTWLAPATQQLVRRQPRWTRIALTDDFFAGPDVADPGDAIQFEADEVTRHRISWPDGTTVVDDASTIDIPS